MGLFKKKLATCPICDAGMPASGNKMGHWLEHSYQIPAGHEGAGGYTWKCACGPAAEYWPHDAGAAAGLGIHMQQRHGISPF
jgi:hypothetical protein